MDVRTIKALTDEAVCIINSLVECFPIYGSDGLYAAQDILFSELTKIADIDAIVDQYNSDEICSLDEYVNVCTFGDEYINYNKVLKKNIYGVIDSGKSGNTLILNGHIDVDIAGTTQHDNEILRSKKSKDKIFGRGTTDMLGGLACIIVCVRYFINNFGLHNGKLILMSVCDEEIGGNGTLRGLSFLNKHFDENTYAIIAEPTECVFCMDSFGFLPFEISIKTTTRHMGCCSDENAYNKLLLMPDIMKKLENLLRSTNSFGKNEKVIIWNVGKISGGSDPAIPIAELTIGMTILYHPKLNIAFLKESLSKLFSDYFQNFDISYSDVSFDGADFNCNFVNRIFENAKIRKENFISPCDARLFSKYKINTAIFGPGSLFQAHSKDEFISIESIKDYIPKLFNVIKGFLNDNFTQEQMGLHTKTAG